MTIPSDTSPEIADRQLALLAQKTPAERVMLAVRLSSEVIRASKKAITRVHPELNSEQVNDLFIELHHGRELADAVRVYRKTRACKTNLS
jgi:hypothetical protein